MMFRKIYKRMYYKINNLFYIIVKGSFNYEGEYWTESEDWRNDLLRGVEGLFNLFHFPPQ